MPHSHLYFNREQSWLEFNSRVLQEALDPSTPLLERLKFISIFASNLDEFFMVRVAGLKKMEKEGISQSDSPGETDAGKVLREIWTRTTDLVQRRDNCLTTEVLPELAKHGIRILTLEELSPKQKEFAVTYFEDEVFPVLTPLAYDPAHPFPFLSNLAIYFLVIHEDSRLDADDERMNLCFVEIPRVLDRLIELPSEDGQCQFILLDELVRGNLQQLFLGIRVIDAFPIRVTRNLDYELLENEVVDLLQTMKAEMVSREHQEAIRLQYDPRLPPVVLRKLLYELDLISSEAFPTISPMYLASLARLYRLDFPALKFPAFNPRLPKQFSSREDIFSIIAQGDLLVHHPYESFYAVTEFLMSAAHDPNVVAIKQTLYRTIGDSPIIKSLIEAAENGKQVTAVIELKARFDERNNMVWARRLERAGVNVVFGFVGLKTHCKATMVIRREKKKLVRYVHLSTGNYNSNTAKLYTDIGLFTMDPDLTYDVSVLFNLVTGYNILSHSSEDAATMTRPELVKAAIAPLNLRERIINLIDEEIQHQKAHGNGLIMAKMNALVDQVIIDKLYDASQAGVKIRLLVRGICCLRPGIAGLSENIEVVSIIDRFLEHSRAFYFRGNGQDRVFLSSADWMPRNMDRRVELWFPIERPELKERVVKEILGLGFADNVKARVMQPDGTYVCRKPEPGGKVIRSQFQLIDLAREAGIQSKPYDIAISHNASEEGERPVLMKPKKNKRHKG